MSGFILSKIISVLGNHYVLINFIGALIGAEETVFLLAILAMQGYFPLWITYVAAFTGFFIADIFWYALGKVKLVDNFIKKHKDHKNLHQFKKISKKIYEKSTFKKLFLTKFFYGLRVPTLIYLGSKKIKFKEFLLNNLLVVAIWSFVIVSIGALAGKGLRIIMDLFEGITLAITYTIIIIVIFIVLLNLMKKFLNKILEKINGLSD